MAGGGHFRSHSPVKVCWPNTACLVSSNWSITTNYVHEFLCLCIVVTFCLGSVHRLVDIMVAADDTQITMTHILNWLMKQIMVRHTKLNWLSACWCLYMFVYLCGTTSVLFSLLSCFV